MQFSSAISRYILLDTVKDIIAFPLWWYTQGFLWFASLLMTVVMETEHRLALRVLARNLFQPMYGQTDRIGRIISFFVRLVILIFRSLYWFFKSLVLLVILAFWLIAPIAVVARLLLFFFSYGGNS